MVDIYCTKDALKTGIKLYKGCTEQNADHETNPNAGIHNFLWYSNIQMYTIFVNEYCHFTLESALEHAEQMRRDHIAKLEQKIERARELEFPVEEKISAKAYWQEVRRCNQIIQEIGCLSELELMV